MSSRTDTEFLKYKEFGVCPQNSLLHCSNEGPADGTENAARERPHTEVLLLDQKARDDGRDDLRNRHQGLHQADDHSLTVTRGPGCDQTGQTRAKYGAAKGQ